MDEQPGVLAAVLGAGKSRRFGSDKRLFELDGKPLIQHALALPLGLGLSTLVVLKPEDELQLQPLLGPWYGNHRLRIHYNVRAEQGMGCSLAAAADYARRRKYTALLVLLADMPYVEPETLTRLIASSQPGRISVPRFNQVSGHPVLFTSHWFKPLAALRGDRGGRALIAANADCVDYIDVDDKGILFDIDQPLSSAD